MGRSLLSAIRLSLDFSQRKWQTSLDLARTPPAARPQAPATSGTGPACAAKALLGSSDSGLLAEALARSAQTAMRRTASAQPSQQGAEGGGTPGRALAGRLPGARTPRQSPLPRVATLAPRPGSARSPRTPGREAGVPASRPAAHAPARLLTQRSTPPEAGSAQQLAPRRVGSGPKLHSGAAGPHRAPGGGVVALQAVAAGSAGGDASGTGEARSPPKLPASAAPSPRAHPTSPRALIGRGAARRNPHAPAPGAAAAEADAGHGRHVLARSRSGCAPGGPPSRLGRTVALAEGRKVGAPPGEHADAPAPARGAAAGRGAAIAAPQAAQHAAAGLARLEQTGPSQDIIEQVLAALRHVPQWPPRL